MPQESEPGADASRHYDRGVVLVLRDSKVLFFDGIVDLGEREGVTERSVWCTQWFFVMVIAHLCSVGEKQLRLGGSSVGEKASQEDHVDDGGEQCQVEVEGEVGYAQAVQESPQEDRGCASALESVYYRHEGRVTM